MRLIGTIAQEDQARRLADYLLTIDLPTEVRPAANGWGLWIVHEDRLDRGRQELDAFLADPDDSRYMAAVRTARDRRREAEELEREHKRKTVDLRGRLDVVSPRRCPVVHILIAISVVAAILTNFGKESRRLRPFYFSPPVVVLEQTPADEASGRPAMARLAEHSAGLEPILSGQIWRLFTPMFIHYGLPHLVFNMLALYWFGGLIELRKGSWVLLALVLTAGPVSFFAQYAWDVQQYGLERAGLPGGMSGVIYALFGFCWMRGEYDPESGLRVSSNTVIWMLLWLALCTSGAFGAIANAAHIGGLAFGVGVGLGPYLFSRRAQPE